MKLENKAEETVLLLKEKSLKIATAESCTGGSLAGLITSVSGASEIFELGIVSYSNEIKNKFLDVEKSTLESFGAISEETAKQMAENIRKKASADIGVAITGAAGPTSSEGHAPGYVFVCVATEKNTKVELLETEFISRDDTRNKAIDLALSLVINFAKEM